MDTDFLEVAGLSEVRGPLSAHVADMAARGLQARPVVVGRHGTPEAVLVPFTMFAELAQQMDDIAAADLARQRLTAGGRHYATQYEDFCAAVGISPEEIDAAEEEVTVAQAEAEAARRGMPLTEPE